MQIRKPGGSPCGLAAVLARAAPAGPGRPLTSPPQPGRNGNQVRGTQAVPSRDNTPRAGAVASPPADRETRSAADAAAPPRPARGGPPPAERPGDRPAERPVVASRRALKNWRVRSRLLLLITIPTLTAVVLGGTDIVSSVQGALTFQRLEQPARLSP